MATGLLLFGISFGYVEAVVVVYLRTIYEPIRLRVHPAQAVGDLFPLMTHEELRATAPERVRLGGAEVVREAATLLMLSGVALAAAGKWKLWLPAFAIAFGAWDLFYYVFLKMLVGWPASLLTWDVLFLIPVPWAAPILAPAIVSVSIILMGLIALRWSVRMTVIHCIVLALGGFLIVLSFVWDSSNIMAGGLPHPFAWVVFAPGEILGVSAFFHAVNCIVPKDRVLGFDQGSKLVIGSRRTRIR
jgi:hypothetical protein